MARPYGEGDAGTRPAPTAKGMLPPRTPSRPPAADAILPAAGLPSTPQPLPQPMRSIARPILVLLIAAFAAACAGNASSGSREAGRTDRLTQADVGDTSYPDVYSFVQAKRGSWLRQRGVDSLNGNPSQVQVYQ